MLTTPLLMVPLLASRPPRSSRDWPPRLIAPPWEAGVPTVVVLPPPRTREETELFNAPPAGGGNWPSFAKTVTFAVAFTGTLSAGGVVAPIPGHGLAGALGSTPGLS